MAMQWRVTRLLWRRNIATSKYLFKTTDVIDKDDIVKSEGLIFKSQSVSNSCHLQKQIDELLIESCFYNLIDLLNETQSRLGDTTK